MSFTVGTYEGHLVGWSFTTEAVSSTESRVTAKLEVAQRVHEGKVTCLAASSRYLCSGGVDESVRVFDLRTRRSVGVLQQHSSTVNCMAMVPPGKVLLTGGEEGNIIVWRCGDWVSQLVMRGHKGGVTALASHPSGRLALSLGKDSTLRLWDLTKGRQVHSQSIPRDSRGAQWSHDGSRFYIHYDTQVGVYNGEDGSELLVLTPPHGRGVGGLSTTPRINALQLIRPPSGGEFIAAGCEGGDVIIWDADLCSPEGAPTPGILATGHDTRVRGMGVCFLERKVASTSTSALETAGTQDRSDCDSTPQGLAKLSNELISFPLKIRGWIFATMGANGTTKLWDGRLLVEGAQTGGVVGAVSNKKTKREGSGTTQAPFLLLGLAPLLGTLKAAENTRPTACI